MVEVDLTRSRRHRDRTGQDNSAIRHADAGGEYMQPERCHPLHAVASWHLAAGVHGLVSSRLAICIASSVTLYGCTGCLLQVAQLW